MGKIYTSYFANWRKHPEDCTKYSVAREHKWEMEIEQLLLLAPSREIFSSYKAGRLDDIGLASQYTQQLEGTDKEELDALVDRLLAEAKQKDVLLLCYEKKSDFCHRHILRDFLNSTYYIDIQEL